MSDGRSARADRPTQADRRARTRAALLEAAARGLSRNGYANLALEQVARDAGYTRGALYHQFENKLDLTLAVVAWAQQTWLHEVGEVVDRREDPLEALLALARGHAEFCRRDIARMAIALRVEFAGRGDHPVGQAVEQAYARLVGRCEGLIEAGRAGGSVPAGPPANVVALAFVGAMEGTVVQLAGQPPYDENLAARAVAGVLGIRPMEEAR